MNLGASSFEGREDAAARATAFILACHVVEWLAACAQCSDILEAVE
jgi:hypothetical protein